MLISFATRKWGLWRIRPTHSDRCFQWKRIRLMVCYSCFLNFWYNFLFIYSQVWEEKNWNRDQIQKMCCYILWQSIYIFDSYTKYTCHSTARIRSSNKQSFLANRHYIFSRWIEFFSNHIFNWNLHLHFNYKLICLLGKKPWNVFFFFFFSRASKCAVLFWVKRPTSVSY